MDVYARLPSRSSSRTHPQAWGHFDNPTLAECISLQGLLVTVAIGLHNVPEGLAVATVLVAKGISPAHAFWWTLATSMPQPLLALPSFMFVDAFQALLPLALGFAAGCMVWIVFAELLPDALADAPHPQVSLRLARRLVLSLKGDIYFERNLQCIVSVGRYNRCKLTRCNCFRWPQRQQCLLRRWRL